MQTRAVLNKDGGSLADIDVEAYARRLTDAFEAEGRALSVEITPGDRLLDALEGAGDDSAVEAILAGGGDGTVSAAADVAWRRDKALGVLPAGTMNLFARTIGLPLELDEAAVALARAKPLAADIATANGKLFVHQFSVGLHPQVVDQRNAFDYSGRFGKMWAGLRAMGRVLSKRKELRVEISADATVETGRYSYIAISNNPYGEGHMPYADRLDRGRLGLYRAGVLDEIEKSRLAADLLRGGWRDNPDLAIDDAGRIELAFDHPDGEKASIDGELVPLENRVTLEARPGALRVLSPFRDWAARAAVDDLRAGLLE